MFSKTRKNLLVLLAVLFAAMLSVGMFLGFMQPHAEVRSDVKVQRFVYGEDKALTIFFDLPVAPTYTGNSPLWINRYAELKVDQYVLYNGVPFVSTDYLTGSTDIHQWSNQGEYVCYQFQPGLNPKQGDTIELLEGLPFLLTTNLPQGAPTSQSGDKLGERFKLEFDGTTWVDVTAEPREDIRVFGISEQDSQTLIQFTLGTKAPYDAVIENLPLEQLSSFISVNGKALEGITLSQSKDCFILDKTYEEGTEILLKAGMPFFKTSEGEAVLSGDTLGTDVLYRKNGGVWNVSVSKTPVAITSIDNADAGNLLVVTFDLPVTMPVAVGGENQTYITDYILLNGEPYNTARQSADLPININQRSTNNYDFWSFEKGTATPRPFPDGTEFQFKKGMGFFGLNGTMLEGYELDKDYTIKKYRGEWYDVTDGEPDISVRSEFNSFLTSANETEYLLAVYCDVALTEETLEISDSVQLANIVVDGASDAVSFAKAESKKLEMHIRKDKIADANSVSVTIKKAFLDLFDNLNGESKVDITVQTRQAKTFSLSQILDVWSGSYFGMVFDSAMAQDECYTKNYEGIAYSNFEEYLTFADGTKLSEVYPSIQVNQFSNHWFLNQIFPEGTMLKIHAGAKFVGTQQGYPTGDTVDKDYVFVKSYGHWVINENIADPVQPKEELSGAALSTTSDAENINFSLEFTGENVISDAVINHFNGNLDWLYANLAAIGRTKESIDRMLTDGTYDSMIKSLFIDGKAVNDPSFGTESMVMVHYTTNGISIYLSRIHFDVTKDHTITMREGYLFPSGNYLGYDIVIEYKADADGTFESAEKTMKIAATGIAVEEDEVSLKGETEYVINYTVLPADATEKTVQFESSDQSVLTVDDFGKVTIVGEGTATVTVSLNSNISVKAEIRFSAVVIKEIKVAAPQKTEYQAGEPLNLTGGSLTVVYTDGTEDAPIALTEAGVSVSSYDPEQAGTQIITVSYQGKTASFEIEVITIVNVELVEPNKTEYITGYELDLTGGKLLITYSDSQTPVEVLLTAEGVRVSGFDKNTAGEQTVSVQYGSIQKTFIVNVLEKTASELVITVPEKLTYQAGEEIDLAGGKVYVKYNDGTSGPEVSLLPAMISGFNKDTVGEQVITVTYEGLTASFKITVAAAAEPAPEKSGCGANAAGSTIWVAVVVLAAGFVCLKKKSA